MPNLLQSSFNGRELERFELSDILGSPVFSKVISEGTMEYRDSSGVLGNLTFPLELDFVGMLCKEFTLMENLRDQRNGFCPYQ